MDDRFEPVQRELTRVRSALADACGAATVALGDPAVQACAPAARCLTRVATALAWLSGALAELRVELRLADAHLSRPADGGRPIVPGGAVREDLPDVTSLPRAG